MAVGADTSSLPEVEKIHKQSTTANTPTTRVTLLVEPFFAIETLKSR
jgi:hypothetical protein